MYGWEPPRCLPRSAWAGQNAWTPNPRLEDHGDHEAHMQSVVLHHTSKGPCESDPEMSQAKRWQAPCRLKPKGDYGGLVYLGEVKKQSPGGKPAKK